MHDVQRFRHTLQSHVFTRAHVRAGMRNEIRNPQRHASRQLFDEHVDTFIPQRVIHRREIDEITVVTNGVLELQSRAVRLPLLDCIAFQRLARPLLLVFGEDLHRLHAIRLCTQKRIVHPAGDGKV